MKTSRKRLARPRFRGLLATRHGALALALSCALVAVGILLFAMGQYRQTVAGNAKQSTVIVATAEIQKGASADTIATQRLYKVMPVLQSQVAPGAIVNAGSIVGKVAANTILPGQQLTDSDFTTPSGVSAVLAPDQRAVAVTLDDAHEVANLLLAGDQVDVYGSLSGSDAVVGLLVPDAVVLKAPISAVGGVGSGGTSGGTVVLRVSDQLSPRVMWVMDNGKVWLELRGVNASNPAPTNTYRPQVFLGNGTSTVPTYAPTTTTRKH